MNTSLLLLQEPEAEQLIQESLSVNYVVSCRCLNLILPFSNVLGKMALWSSGYLLQ